MLPQRVKKRENHENQRGEDRPCGDVITRRRRKGIVDGRQGDQSQWTRKGKEKAGPAEDKSAAIAKCTSNEDIITSDVRQGRPQLSDRQCRERARNPPMVQTANNAVGLCVSANVWPGDMRMPLPTMLAATTNTHVQKPYVRGGRWLKRDSRFSLRPDANKNQRRTPVDNSPRRQSCCRPCDDLEITRMPRDTPPKRREVLDFPSEQGRFFRHRFSPGEVRAVV